MPDTPQLPDLAAYSDAEPMLRAVGFGIRISPKPIVGDSEWLQHITPAHKRLSHGRLEFANVVPCPVDAFGNHYQRRHLDGNQESVPWHRGKHC